MIIIAACMETNFQDGRGPDYYLKPTEQQANFDAAMVREESGAGVGREIEEPAVHERCPAAY